MTRPASSFVLALTLAACASPVTELIVVVDTDLMPGTELTDIELLVTEPDGMTHPIAAPLPGTPIPVSLGVVHRGGALGPVTVTARGLASGDERVLRTVRTSFVVGESRLVRLDLWRHCVGATCSGDVTCGDDGACVAIEVPPERLPRFSGMVERFDAAGLDAGCAPSSIPETCDTIDQDCDGRIDEGACTCMPACMLDHAVAICTAARTCDIASCETGWANCDTDDTTGCERSIRTTTDCSACDRPCTSTAGTTSCADGTCRVVSCNNPRQADCDGDPSDCEARVESDDANCGRCGNVCPSGTSCRMGACG